MYTLSSAREQNVRTASGLNALAAVWLILAPFLLAYAGLGSALWNDVVVGIVVLGLAAVRLASPAQAIGLSWINLILGIWLIVAPFVLNYAEFLTPRWNDVILGIVIGLLAIWSAMASSARSRLPARY